MRRGNRHEIRHVGFLGLKLEYSEFNQEASHAICIRLSSRKVISGHGLTVIPLVR